jgi:hypothetical protein
MVIVMMHVHVVVHHGLIHAFFHHRFVFGDCWRRNRNSGQSGGRTKAFEKGLGSLE